LSQIAVHILINKVTLRCDYDPCLLFFFVYLTTLLTAQVMVHRSIKASNITTVRE